jgi:GNAT superfamily N-acetyltransferase
MAEAERRTHRVEELGPERTALGHRAMLELRPRIGDAAVFATHVNSALRPEGYRMVASFEEGDERAVAVAGFRITHHLAWGHTLYVDDLSTRSAFRGRGHAAGLLRWLLDEARRLGCDQLHLDSGVGAERQAAHRLYLDHRLRISAHHFSIELGQTPSR